MSETKELKYNEPWILQRADPYVYRHTDGMYYFTASLPEYNGIALRRASTLAGLADAEETMIWKKHDKGIMSVHIWAPELHYLDGKWYIYFAGGDIDDIWAIRPYVLECADADPITGTWVEKGKMQRATTTGQMRRHRRLMTDMPCSAEMPWQITCLSAPNRLGVRFLR